MKQPRCELDVYELHLRELHSLPDNFRFYRWEAGPHAARESLYLQMWGVCCPLKTRGKNQGRPNWRASDKSTERTFVLSTAEQEKVIADYVERTGFCDECFGAKERAYEWNFVTGETKARVCSKCNGTGKAVETAEVLA
jgi:hypothetical protein